VTRRPLSPAMAQALADLRAAGADGLRAAHTDASLCALERRGLARTNPAADRVMTAQWLLTYP
jgi:hypothetical protein